CSRRHHRSLPRCPPRRTRGTGRAFLPSARRRWRGSRSPLPRRNRLHPRRSRRRWYSPAPPGTGAGGLLLRSRARRLQRRFRNRTPLHPNAEERAPRVPPSDCIPASVLDSLEWSRGRRQTGLKRKEKKEGRKNSRWSWSRRRKKWPWLLKVGVFCATWLWEEDEFAVMRADSG